MRERRPSLSRGPSGLLHAAEAPRPPSLKDLNGLVLLLGACAALGGFVFGYDTCSMSSAILQVKRPRGDPWDSCPGLAPERLDPLKQELVISFVVLGAFVGSLISGMLNDYLGRRRILLGGSTVFGVGALWTGLAPDITNMLLARLLAGIGVGISSHTVPLYIAECAPAHLRGSLCFLNDLMITAGQVTASVVSVIFFYAEVRNGWRWILGIDAAPALLMFVGFFFMPESPRWLLAQGRPAEAKQVLARLRKACDESELEQEFHDAVTFVSEETPLNESASSLSGVWARYFKDGRVRSAITLGCGLQAIQQWAGINTIMYYGASVLQKASPETPYGCFSAETQHNVALTVLFASGQLVGVFFSWLLVDRVGRRPLLLISMVGVSACLTATGFAFSDNSVSQMKVVVCVMLYLATFGVGLSAVPWTVNAEIYPLHVRAKCISLSTCTNWMMNYIVSQTFLSLARRLSLHPMEASKHPDGIFWLYAGIALLGLVFVYFRMPETMGLSLEQIGELFTDDSLHLGK